ncbi:hypothetical protein SAY87_009712 [Trapa incisa]|uniref:Mechanosensitive ion channel protein n=1 Tax=Trapa incisa TaxID=236973 RepID=A0AAN7JVH8_9MYRT|nr:hypothetical protein SAY87_009712 [Trapa incisa]
MEAGDGASGKKDSNEVVVVISGGGDPIEVSSSTSRAGRSSLKSNVQLPKLQAIFEDATFIDPSTAQEEAKSSPCPPPPPASADKPPRSPPETLTGRRTLTRSSFSKPKSRFEEPISIAASPVPLASPQDKNATTSLITPKDNQKPPPHIPLAAGDGEEDGKDEDEDEDEDDKVYSSADIKFKEMSGKKYRKAVLFERAAFVCIAALLIVCLTVSTMLHEVIWGLKLWRWCVLVLVILCGRLVTGWLMKGVVFLIEMNFLLKKKVLYFVYGLKKSVQTLVWLSLILLAWELLISRGAGRSDHTKNILSGITRGIAGVVIGAAIWLVKTLLIKLLSSSFQCKRFFERIQESIFHQYIVRTLSGPPLMEMAENVRNTTAPTRTAPSGRLSFRMVRKSSAREDVIDVEKLNKMNQGKVSAWTMKGLIDVVKGSGLSTLSGALDEDGADDDEGRKNEEITNEYEAKAAAYQIFKNVAKPGSKFIHEEDLLRFMKQEEVDNVIPLFEGAAEKKMIQRSALKNWLVKVYLERKSLAHSLNDAKTAIEELNRLSSGVVVVVGTIVWLLMLQLLTTRVIVFISSQLLLVVFVFGNTVKTVFEAIIFVFVMHPFDVGDRCVIDGIQMVVEEVNLLTTIFLRFDNEKVFYPNSVLATKPISNFYRSPDMGDSVEFDIDFSTSADSIAALKSKIKAYIDGKPQHWRPAHSVIVREIADVNSLKLALYVTHTINFQNFSDRSGRRSDLVLELKRILEELHIKYRLLPQEVVLNNNVR